ncbi:hypothetical protein ACI2LF_23460 [Kribbella sp. NPDC020789]
MVEGPGSARGERPTTEIIGVTTDPRHDVASGGTGLYEFWTADGVPVYLHDTTLVSVELRPPERSLVLRFDYEPQWTPEAAARTPIVVMQFDEVAISEWTHDPESDDETPAVVRGQVEDFAHFDGNAFRLTTYQSEIQFTAGRLAVSLWPS